jgi:uncharacterized membrane protein
MYYRVLQMFAFFNPPLFALHIVIVLLLVLALPLIIIYLFLRLTEAAFEQVGFDHWHASLAVFGSIFGSLIDIPLHSGTIGFYPGWYISLASIFSRDFSTTFNPFYLAINLGGAIIPLIISIHLVLTHRVPVLKAAIGILIVTVITYHLAAPVPNQGIVLPFWITPAFAAICGLVLGRGCSGAPALAYISGSKTFNPGCPSGAFARGSDALSADGTINRWSRRFRWHISNGCVGGALCSLHSPPLSPLTRWCQHV